MFLRPVFLLVLLMALAVPSAASAQPMIFSRENITIVTMPRPLKIEKDLPVNGKKKEEKEKEEENGKKEKTAQPMGKRYIISTEIYPMSATQIGWFSSRETLPKGRGILIVLENKDELSLGWSNVTTSYDVLFIQGNGKIQAIVPDLVLGELTDPLEITGRIKAVLYLRSGSAEEMDIRPGDRVEHSLFRPSPKILQ